MAPSTTLPHESDATFLTDGGLETTLIFLEGFDLPCFASFDLLKDERGYLALKEYYLRYLNIAKDFGFGFVLESPTWRANPDWIMRDRTRAVTRTSFQPMPASPRAAAT